MLHAQVLGEGPPVLFLHGLFGEGENLKSLARPLARNWQCHLLDLPNHGQSPHSDSTDYLQMSSAVAEYAGSVGSPVAVLGHSMGGKVAMALALKQPELVTALVVLDIAPRSYSPSHIHIMDSLLGLELNAIESRSDADQQLESSIPSKPVRSFLLKNLVSDGDGYRWKLNLGVLRSSYDSILGWPAESLADASYPGSATFAAGDRSDYLKPERDRKTIERWFPHSAIQVVEGAGHWIHAEKPEAVLHVLRTVLSN